MPAAPDGEDAHRRPAAAGRRRRADRGADPRALLSGVRGSPPGVRAATAGGLARHVLADHRERRRAREPAAPAGTIIVRAAGAVTMNWPVRESPTDGKPMPDTT